MMKIHRNGAAVPWWFVFLKIITIGLFLGAAWASYTNKIDGETAFWLGVPGIGMIVWCYCLASYLYPWEKMPPWPVVVQKERNL